MHNNNQNYPLVQSSGNSYTKSRFSTLSRDSQYNSVIPQSPRLINSDNITVDPRRLNSNVKQTNAESIASILTSVEHVNENMNILIKKIKMLSDSYSNKHTRFPTMENMSPLFHTTYRSPSQSPTNNKKESIWKRIKQMCLCSCIKNENS